MIIAFDTYYFADTAKTACIAFKHWTGKAPQRIYSELLTGVEGYVPGQFYKRELPCILSLLRQIDLLEVEAIIIDGFVMLDDDGMPGLGGHLYQAIDVAVPVIGVAKTNFATLTKNKTALLRGNSIRPLYITAMGISVEEATEKIRIMDGGHRIPTLLKLLDRLTKEPIV